MKDGFKGIGIYVFIILMLVLVLIMGNFDFGLGGTERLTDDKFYADLESGQIDKIQVDPIKVGTAGMGNATIVYKATDSTRENGAVRSLYISDVESFREFMRENYPDVPIYVKAVKADGFLSEFLPMLITMIIVLIVFTFIMNRAQGGGSGNKVMSFGKSKARMIVDDKNRIRFNNVAGLDEEKEEMKEVVEFLRAPKKFSELGARIPKGVLLVGPPGTGKTYLAKAVAGEAGVPFFSISGSDFVEMFVGVGASRVRDLFEQAKKNAPCIVFIDEIDAVGRRRGAGLGGGHDEREQTLNQLLVEMDGFGVNEGVIVIAATNRVDILDPALLRPGRFDRRIVVNRPDVKGREEVLTVHSKGKPLGEDVDLRVVARTTAGFTPADLENLLNEAAIYAARENRKYITMQDIQNAFIKIGIGTEKKSRIITDKEKRITAFHEAGHAIIHHVISELDPVHSISIIPTGMAGGYTMPLPEEDTMYMSKTQMESEIVALLGGRVAEELVLQDVTTGASNDIERATGLARGMVTKYGMSDVLGPIQFGDDNEEVFLGRDIGHTRNYGEEVAGTIDREIRKIVDDAYSRAKSILTEHMQVLHKTAELLLKKEKITGEEFAKLFRSQEIPDPATF
ncbi:ATP-dependent zinc metalloprotease FtsH [Bianquea renquensis]|uniref:ATP-dependent zinc metalloprotease FtsH n=1 Tax=Bianquea renquensis TaxID=2763661 RepID=A0A926DX57_9FIRM|nr:ATP-dependent zinc metalloprotease FtsH [Bianquea renquensis]MBC8545242.1 ATP-dependent metallopeptidase FtsH/Yme1/Tma family protein [Bianquea renquensis]